MSQVLHYNFFFKKDYFSITFRTLINLSATSPKTGYLGLTRTFICFHFEMRWEQIEAIEKSSCIFSLDASPYFTSVYNTLKG